MTFFIKKMLASLALPPTSFLLLGLLGIFLARRRLKLGYALATMVPLVLIVLSLPVIGNALLKSLEHYSPITVEQLNNSQVLVVLGGGNNKTAPEYFEGATVSALTLERLHYAAYLHNQSGKQILVTGGAPYGGTSEAETMAAILKRDFRIDNLILEAASKDTAENAKFSARLLDDLKIKNIALVTHAWHMHRAVQLFETQGFTVHPAPTGFTASDPSSMYQWLPGADSLSKTTTALHEILGLLHQTFYQKHIARNLSN